jgi:predicted DNA binding CopG/RHH family protein
MSTNSQNLFNDLILDEEEQAIEDAIGRGEYTDVSDYENSKKLIEEAAKSYVQLNATKPITLRVKQKDLIKIKVKAKQNNVPYQTLLGAVLHDFAESEKKLIIK